MSKNTIIILVPTEDLVLCGFPDIFTFILIYSTIDYDKMLIFSLKMK
jgi:hypothetical protein